MIITEIYQPFIVLRVALWDLRPSRWTNGRKFCDLYTKKYGIYV